VRSLLKKIKQRVLVGDDVLVTSVDWTDGRGGFEPVRARVQQEASSFGHGLHYLGCSILSPPAAQLRGDHPGLAATCELTFAPIKADSLRMIT